MMQQPFSPTVWTPNVMPFMPAVPSPLALQTPLAMPMFLPPPPVPAIPILQATSVYPPSPYMDLANEIEYKNCIPMMPLQISVLYPYAAVKCKQNVQYFGKNEVRGVVYLDRDVIWRGNSNIKIWSRVNVGARSDIGESQTFVNSVNIGTDCKIRRGGVFQDSIIGDRVTIGLSAIVEGIIKNSVTIGDKFRLHPNSIIMDNIRIGDNVVVGVGSTINGNLDDNSCIGDGVNVTVHVPPFSILNNDGVVRPRTRGKHVQYVLGRCIER